MDPILSICIPTFNRCKQLMHNLEYFRDHNSSDIEIVISDNNSTDETNKSVTDFISINNLYNFIYNKNDQNIGPDANFKKVLSMATGKYALLLGDDDFLNKDFFERVLPFLREGDYSFVMLSSKEMMKLANGKICRVFSVDEIDNFLLTVKVHITFMSLMIFRSNILKENIFKEIYFKDNLYQSFLATNVIKYNRDFKFTVLFYEPFAYNGATSAQNYNFYTVFVDNVISLYVDCLPNKKYRQILSLYKKCFIRFLIKFTLLLKSENIKLRLYKSNINILKHYAAFWFVLLPCYLCPSFILKLARKFYKRIRR